MLKEFKSESYDPESCCNSDCYMLSINKNSDEPCWGAVYTVDEVQLGDELGWIHACKGHEEEYGGDSYCKETK